MSKLLVALTAPDDTIYEKLEKQGRAYQLTSTLFLARPEISTSSLLMERLGINTEEGSPTGLVVDLVKGLVVSVLPKNAADWYKVALDVESGE